MNLENFYKKLEGFSNFENEENLIPFIETVEEIVSYYDPRSIPIIVEYFDDNTDYNWVMQSMIHALESFPNEIYVPEIIKCIPQGMKHSPYWMDILFNRIFNSPSCLEVFKKHISLIPKESMVELLNLVARESDHHKDLCDELRRLVEEKAKAQ